MDSASALHANLGDWHRDIILRRASRSWHSGSRLPALPRRTYTRLTDDDGSEGTPAREDANRGDGEDIDFNSWEAGPHPIGEDAEERERGSLEATVEPVAGLVSPDQSTRNGERQETDFLCEEPPNSLPRADENANMGKDDWWMNARFWVRENIVCAPRFDRFILVIILANSLALAAGNPAQPDSTRSRFVHRADIGFTTIFVAEMVVKLYGLGIWNGLSAWRTVQDDSQQKEHVAGYFKNPWNVLDFVIVVSGLTVLAISSDGSGTSAIRLLRVLRPLRAFNRLRGLQAVVATVLESLRPLGQVLLLFMFLFIIYTIVGLQLFAGVLRRSCFEDGLPRHVVVERDDPFAISGYCNERGSPGRQCPDGEFCAENANNPAFGLVSFDNFGVALLNLWTTISLSNWAATMYRLQDAVGPALPAIFYVSLILVGTFFAANLVLAVVSDTYSSTAVRQRLEWEESTLQARLKYTHIDAEIEEALKFAGYHQRRSRQVRRRKKISRREKGVDDDPEERRAVDGQQQQQQEAEEPMQEDPAMATIAVAAWERAEYRPDLTEHLHRESEGEGESDRGSDSDDESAGEKPKVESAVRDDPWVRCDDAGTENGCENRDSSMGEPKEHAGAEEAGTALRDEEALMGRRMSEPPPLEDVMNVVETEYETMARKELSVGKRQRRDRWRHALELVYEADITLRRRNKWLIGKPVVFGRLSQLVQHPLFTGFITVCIVANAVFLALDREGISGTLRSVREQGNMFLTYVFVAEMVLKLIGLGSREYARDPFNLFDAVIVVVSIIEVMVDAATEDEGGALSVLRIFRLLRVLKLAKQVKPLRILLVTILQSLPDVGWMTTLLVLFMFLFSVLGFQLFALSFDAAALDEFPPFPFDSMVNSVMAVATILTGDNWNRFMAQNYEVAGAASIVYFIVVHVVGAYLIVSLFVAILLHRFSQQTDEAFDEEDMMELAVQYRLDENKGDLCRPMELGTPLPVAYCIVRAMDDLDRRRAAEVQKKRDRYFENTGPKCIGYSFGCISPDNSFRRALFALAVHPWFEAAVIILIFVNCIFLALEGPSVEDGSTLRRILEIGDATFTVLFAVEAVVKIIAFSVAAPVHGYFRSGWNRLDFFIVLASIASQIFPGINIIRALRALRPLRVVVRSKQIKVVVQALLYAVPNISNVVAFTFMLWTVFAILGVNLLKGRFGECTDSTIELKEDCHGTFNGTEGVQTRQWDVPVWNFDNVKTASLTLFRVATLDDWATVARHAMDSTGPGVAPKAGANWPMMFYFLAFIIIGSFFSLNLFVGVIIDNFNRLKEEFDGSAFMTVEQRQWSTFQRLIATVQLSTQADAPEQPLRRIAFKVASHPWFEWAVLIAIILNTLVLCTTHYGAADEFVLFLSTANKTFTALFTLEAATKITAYGWFLYWKDSWNRFDFIVVVLSLVGIFWDTGVGASVVRVARLARVFRLIKRAKTLQHYFQTLMVSVPSLWNIGGLLFVLFYIFTVLGISLFGRAPLDNVDEEGLSRHANFQSFDVGILTLWRTATGDGWGDIMETMIEHSTGAGIAFSVAFQVCVAFVMTNLFIAVILESFGDEDGKELEQQEMGRINAWTDVWSRFDPAGLRYVPFQAFPLIMSEAPKPFGFGSFNLSRAQILRRLKYMHVPAVKKPRTTFRFSSPEARVAAQLSRATTVAETTSRVFSNAGRKTNSSLQAVGSGNISSTDVAGMELELTTGSNAPRRRRGSTARQASRRPQNIWCVEFRTTLKALARCVLQLDVAQDEAKDAVYVHELYAASIIERTILRAKAARQSD